MQVRVVLVSERKGDEGCMNRKGQTDIREKRNE
jgi:hypothetical protein